MKSKNEFHSSKNAIAIKNADIDTIISHEFPCAKNILQKKYIKDFVGYKNNEKITPLCVLLSKMGGYYKNFDGALIEDEEFLKKYNNVEQSEQYYRKKLQ